MSAAAPRRFFWPMTGMALLFAGLGPAIGGALFIPLAFVMAAPWQVAAVGHLTWIAALIGHTFALVGAYFVGIAPAASTGFVHAVADWAAPRALPRSLIGAAIGGAMTYGLAQWLASLGAAINATIAVDTGQSAGDWLRPIFSGGFDKTLEEALVASGAVAGGVCAMAASLLGLTTQPGGACEPMRPSPSGDA